MKPRCGRSSTSLRRVKVLIGLALASPACAVGPTYTPTPVTTPPDFAGAPPQGDRRALERPWWEVFRDPTLLALIREATSSAFDLRIAMSRVEIARQSYRSAVWTLAPTVGGTAGAGAARGQPSIPSFYPPLDTPGNFGAFATASWEVDVWGRIRRIAEEAEYEYRATDEDRRGVYITLIGDVAERYFDLLALDRQLAYLEGAVETRRQTVELFRTRSVGGVGNALEVARAEADLRDASWQRYDVAIAIASTEYTLSYLIGRPPGPIARPGADDPWPELPEVPSGLPSELLNRRPDIRAAAARVQSANARIGAEQADYLPSFDLTGYVGVVSDDLTQAAGVRGGSANLNWTLPFLGGERERAEVASAQAAWDLAVTSYQSTAINAFREVAEALVSVERLRQVVSEQAGVVGASEEAQRIALDRYTGGVANYLDVLTAQERLLSAQLAFANAQGRQRSAFARLYRVLGGGWPLDTGEQTHD